MNRFSSPTLADVILESTEDRLRELNTCEPGEIVSYDSTKQTCTVKPVTSFGVLDDDGEYVLEERPQIFDVPVIFPHTKAGYLSFPIVAGDTGLILYSMRDIGQWRYTGQHGSPGDHRVCTMAGAMFLPGLVPNANQIAGASNTNVVLAPLGAAVVALGSPTATDFVALASKVDTEIGKLWTALAAHVHGGVTTGGGATSTPVVTNTSAPTAATKVKAF